MVGDLFDAVLSQWTLELVETGTREVIVGGSEVVVKVLVQLLGCQIDTRIRLVVLHTVRVSTRDDAGLESSNGFCCCSEGSRYAAAVRSGSDVKSIV